MVQIHKENINSPNEGTIIDIETIGYFNEFPDSRRYIKIVPVIFGYIDSECLHIHCAKMVDSLEKLKKIIVQELGGLERPFYAFNSDFERGDLIYPETMWEACIMRSLSLTRFKG